MKGGHKVVVWGLGGIEERLALLIVWMGKIQELMKHIRKGRQKWDQNIGEVTGPEKGLDTF